jgi:apolipoprotein N-acyltransferase
MGTVNGYGQSLVAMLRLFGPFSGSSLLSWSITNGLGFPLDHHFMFYVVSALLLLILGLSFLLPTTINEPKTTNDTNPTS